MTPNKRYTRADELPARLIEKFHQTAAKATRNNVGCLIWPGLLDRDGYGGVRHKQGDAVWWIGAHRLAVLLTVEEVPDWAVVDHICRTRACFDVSHLRLVTSQENTACGLVPGPRACCKAGHLLSGDNLHLVARSDGRVMRICRRCRYLAKDRYRKRHRASG